jgi:hypothetical protein
MSSSTVQTNAIQAARPRDRTERVEDEGNPHIHGTGCGGLPYGEKRHPRDGSRSAHGDHEARPRDSVRAPAHGRSDEAACGKNDVVGGLKLTDRPSARSGYAQSDRPAGATHWAQGEWLRAVLAARRRREIGQLAVIVAVALAGFADNHTGESWSSIKRIAEEIGAKANWRGDCSAVSRALAQLKSAGLLRIASRGHMRTSLYVPTVPDKPSPPAGLVTSRNVTSVTISAKVATHLPQGVGYTSAKVAELRHRELHPRTSPKETCARVPRGPFERFWEVWPNHKSESRARDIFANICRDDKTLAAIIAGVERYAVDKPYERDWMNPITFLLQRRWEDEPAPIGKHPRPAQNRFAA